jgi:ParB/RepB/Spo0J family partition protein
MSAIDDITSGSVKAGMKSVGASSGDLWMVPIDSIKMIDDFNVRTENQEYREHVQSLATSIYENGFWRDKPLSGFIAKEAGEDVIYVVDGHSRLTAAKMANDLGAEITHLPMVTKPAGTNAEDLIVGLVVSNSGKPLTPLEKAAVCKKLAHNYSMEPAEIGRRLNFSTNYVVELLKLVSAPKKIRNMVESGQISAANAVAAVEKHGSNAASFIEEKLEVAKSAGKTKVTKAVLAPKKNMVLEAGLDYIEKALVLKEDPTPLFGMLAHLTDVSIEAIQAKLKGEST